MLGLELRPAALAAEVEGLGRPRSTEAVPATAATVIPQIGSTAVVAAGGACGGARQRSLARIESATRAGVRAPMSRPAGVSIRSKLSGRARRRRAARRSRPGRACGWQRGQRTECPRPGRDAVRRAPLARAPPPRAPRSPDRTSNPPAHPQTTCKVRAPGRARWSERAIGVSPSTRIRGARRIGSRNTSIAPPERQGFWTVTAAVLARNLLPSLPGLRGALVAERQDSQQHSLTGLRWP